MTTEGDVLRIWVFCDEAERATAKLAEMVDAVLSDEGPGLLADLLKGARIKAEAAGRELAKCRAFVEDARQKARGA